MSLSLDPFNDYTAREMRNNVSSVFVEGMGTLHHVHQMASRFDRPLEPVSRDYLAGQPKSNHHATILWSYVP